MSLQDPTSARHSLGIVGLGKMGSGIAAHALKRGFDVVGLDKHAVPAELQQKGLRTAASISDFRRALTQPRIVMLYIPAGALVDAELEDLCSVLEPGDIVIDGGNSYWGDSIRRHARLKDKGLHFIDAGTSGGPGGARDGACFMIGGDDAPIGIVEPLLRALAVEGGYVRAGGPGSGHYVKLVHNGIEFGMLQAIGEGMDLLERYREKLPTADILACWSHGSVIRSWLIELMEALYRDRSGLSHTPDYVEDTGEVNWLVEDALHMEVPIPVISQSVMQLFTSRDRTHNWARAIAMMRHGFGGHPYGADAGLQRERRTGRVGGFPEGGS